MKLDDLKNLIKNGKFKSPTKGEMSLKEIIEDLIDYKNELPNAEYRVVIGTDSEEREKGIDFVSVIAVHRMGKGGRYFWLRSYDEHSLEMRSRIYKEAVLSLALAQALLEQEAENKYVVVSGKTIKKAMKNLENNVYQKNEEFIFKNGLEIHVDIGSNGPTRAMIREIVGMVRGSGFDIKIKPEAFAASNIADKYV